VNYIIYGKYYYKLIYFNLLKIKVNIEKYIMKIFSGSTNKDFAKKVCANLNIKLSSLTITKFADGEIKILITESIRHEDCFIIQPTCRNNYNNSSVNDSIIELLILIDALKRGSAKTVNVIMPYYGYQRQDRKDYSRAPISACVIARCLEAQNINRIIVYDLHAGQISGFFSNNCPLDNLYTEYYFIKYIKEILLKKYKLNDIMIVAPDEGAVKNNFRIASILGVECVSIFKYRDKDNSIGTMKLLGDVKDKVVILIDDIIDTAGTACNASNLLKEKGALEIYFFACHGLFSKDAITKIEKSQFNKVIVTNTIPHIESIYKNNLIDIIDVSWSCSYAISSQINGESLSDLYSEESFNEKNGKLILL
jgi:ribose-phosphate pyrophosphokinase